MKHQEKSSKQIVEQAVQGLRAEQPEPEMLRAAGERVWQRLSDEAGAGEAAVSSIRGCADVRALLPQYRSDRLGEARRLLVEAHLHECVACRRALVTQEVASPATLPWQHELPRPRGGGFRWVMAVAAMLVFGVSAYFLQEWIFSGPPGLRARVESFDGGVYRVGFKGVRPQQAGEPDGLTPGPAVR